MEETVTDRIKRLTPRRAVRKFCLDCVGGLGQVHDCLGDTLYDGPCIFLPYRMGRARPKVRLIRKMCLYCMGGHQFLIKDCPSKGCFLNPYRMGKSGRIGKKGTAEGRFVTRIDQTTPAKG